MPISPKILHFYMDLERAINKQKIRSEAFFYFFFYAVKDAKKAPFWVSGVTMTEQSRSIRSLGCDVKGVTRRVLECYHTIVYIERVEF